MTTKKEKNTEEKNTKEMSSDTQKVRNQEQTAPPQGSGENNPNNTKDDSSDAEAQKGHA